LRSFEQHLPFPEPPELAKHWEFLYERSVGCIGILKEWLTKALSAALRNDETSLSLRHLEDHAASVAQCQKVLSEIVEGERRLTETAEGRASLRMHLGLPRSSIERVDPSKAAGETDSRASVSTERRTARRPGVRLPVRDAIGKPEFANVGD